MAASVPPCGAFSLQAFRKVIDGFRDLLITVDAGIFRTVRRSKIVGILDDLRLRSKNVGAFHY